MNLAGSWPANSAISDLGDVPRGRQVVGFEQDVKWEVMHGAEAGCSGNWSGTDGARTAGVWQ